MVSVQTDTSVLLAAATFVHPPVWLCRLMPPADLTVTIRSQPVSCPGSRCTGDTPSAFLSLLLTGRTKEGAINTQSSRISLAPKRLENICKPPSETQYILPPFFFFFLETSLYLTGHCCFSLLNSKLHWPKPQLVYLLFVIKNWRRKRFLHYFFKVTINYWFYSAVPRPVAQIYWLKSGTSKPSFGSHSYRV